MLRLEGREVIVLGDKTSHGGTVISASGNLSYKGRKVARVGDKVTCPKCKGTYVIAEGSPSTGNLADVARHGDKVSCGASLLAGTGSPDVDALAAVLPEEDPCAYVTANDWNASGPDEEYDRIRTSEVGPLEGPLEGEADLGNGREPALQYQTTVNGNDMTIVVANTEEGRQQAQDLHRSLGVVPPELSGQVNEIVITPHPHPDDTMTEDEDGNRVGTATGAQTSYGLDQGKPYADVTIYPHGAELGYDYVILHELSHPEIGINSGDLPEVWGEISQEEPGPSRYCETNEFEDFCESAAMYFTVRGGPCEEAFAEAYPKRYEILNQRYGGGNQ